MNKKDNTSIQVPGQYKNTRKQRNPLKHLKSTLSSSNSEFVALFYVSGKIDLQELQKAFQELGIDIDENEAKKLLKR